MFLAYLISEWVHIDKITGIIKIPLNFRRQLLNCIKKMNKLLAIMAMSKVYMSDIVVTDNCPVPKNILIKIILM